MPQTKNIPPQQFGAVLERAKFLDLFPHRFDFIRSAHGIDPTWRTVSDHLLSDRLIQQGAYMYGVRFGPQTEIGRASCRESV